ncbi:serine/threonine protein phosphatase 1 [Clostridium acetobutylicum]|uniref:Serine/threonine protein phosphatase n=1 Tax=Clostridium acetobutylicum (strain ATCC 824 / DSM 792 / JCM 1419 / IAM 19013 / LMG 5710 / NBRC 13948 / NRRL B-527 / VKM B-1787 / 2291 / W) TaxID=272562 RepID=Q97FF3_CLOAB|nr:MULTISPECIES: metallophosphoesterase family protein [Clostridium]AAK80731.1 Serine/threonine protein phosphatase [Clostridium acetobutylicum ATCC 824]ADZ21832.1 Serine/threonine protein phosphatase [Clostridium acetobutylicum EA 2018]AEI33104.1 Serine/threonine protein phosphatase [Clostridium acetobutylicum DSM 1731]AWV78855.1 fructose-bisphosphatase class III [Clostridium acetobutylicum]KHD37097.1 serine/threonine protein phosphatase [Clostridium acetobutylicum]
MARYVVSDLHGCYNKFTELLRLVRFSDKDELYIIGDIFDRGPEPLKILDYIYENKNVYLIKGNHEYMYQKYYEDKNPDLWFLNGGKVTFNEIIKRGKSFNDKLYEYIKSLPIYKVVDNNILVHAQLHFPPFYSELSIKEILRFQLEETVLWSRHNIGKEKKIKGYNIICGHTPVQSIKNTTEVKILRRKNTFYIDCGCVYGDKAGGKLAMLRLEDFKEFYV